MKDADKKLWQAQLAGIKPLKGKHGLRQIKKPRQKDFVARDSVGKDFGVGAQSIEAQNTGGQVLAYGLDARLRRDIMRGAVRLPRLDLHGATQERAHKRFIGFVGELAAAGEKAGLVITGKGVHGGIQEGMDNEGGVLRRAFPHWCAQCRASLVAYEQADARHGGAGAFYIHVRKTSRIRTSR